MDVPGVTYRLPFYEALHWASRYGGVLGAETASTVSSRGDYVFPDEPLKNKAHASGVSSSYDLECCAWSNLPDDDWAMQEDNGWTLGEFVWTGFDYLGELTPHNKGGSRSAYFGIYDLAGLPKDRAYLYRAHWRKDAPTLHVLPHWTWPATSPSDTLRFVRVDVVDVAGTVCPWADDRLSFAVTGGRYVCACNGNPRDLDSFSGPSMKVFHGSLVVTVAPGETGPTVLTVTAAGLLPVRYETMMEEVAQ